LPVAPALTKNLSKSGRCRLREIAALQGLLFMVL
jgi:hypothetical protein